MKTWPAWSYNPRPKGFVPADPLRGARSKLRKLVTACTEDQDGVYRLPGTTFRMTLVEQHDTLCPKCDRPLSTWPLKRSKLCSPPSWVRCIRPVESTEVST